MLNFNSNKFDFWKIYDSIKQFYPIGIPKVEGGIFYSYPGLKKLESIIVENIHDENKFNNSWQSFTLEIERAINKRIIGTTYGQAPSFSSYLELDSCSADNLTRTKYLHFLVSLVGPFYTIVGEDSNAVKVNDQHFRSTNYLVVSPENEYAEAFNLLCSMIETRFKDFRFIPFHICKQEIEGLDVRYTDDNLNLIFNALFNNQIDLNSPIIGNILFKSENWIKDEWVDDGARWTAYPVQLT